ncbi:MAG: phosphotransferase, partial [Clostridia bacterium]|nr:phosphotransferase [Clostridia bacterium]
MNLDHVIAERGLKTIYRDGDRVLKVFALGYSKADILNEALNQARVEETGIRMPRVLEVTTLEDGRWVIVSDYIEGKTLAQLMEENPDKLEEYLELFVDLQLSIHEKRA